MFRYLNEARRDALGLRQAARAALDIGQPELVRVAGRHADLGDGWRKRCQEQRGD